ncbi:cardiolipin synthase [Kovacikia minuta CCNUW1]|uniref:cardiolipin synthase n=1 Tax=Kovacikia minuta TaxID=2931930 RepID=UPI001CCDA00C|nr:cardiolipin synthase [Kovacikia minuta]UBF23791.1 cardiolipin synthase [Kovacikia minuta CCNUW1]
MAIDINFLKLYSTTALLVHLLGILNAAHAVMNVRSSQGAIAWSISLITFPWVAMPLYWILGRNQFHGYAEVMRSVFNKHKELVRHGYEELMEYKTALPEHLEVLERLAERFSGIPFTCGNAAELLIDGEQTYGAILRAIAAATDYVLLQSYIINDDTSGNQFKQALIAKVNQNVRVYVLYDEIGSKKMTRAYMRSLREHGVQVSGFRTTKGKGNRFQLNFRNHRKIIVVDGETGFVGGLNIGDEYLGKDPKLSPWRDTHLRIKGPSVQRLQVSFLQDWYWATGKLLDARWVVQPDLKTNATALVLPTGPADSVPACNLFYVNAINLAQTRLWIASPYFVPDESTLSALKLAAMRGVDVRIILPNHPDHLFVYLCSFSYYNEMRSAGIKFYRFKEGFMHQKIILIDRDLAGVGTVNLDNRSFFLNFEVMGYVIHPSFINRVEKMLQDDLAASISVDLTEYDQKPLWFKLIVRIARLLSPIL